MVCRRIRRQRIKRGKDMPEADPIEKEKQELIQIVKTRIDEIEKEQKQITPHRIHVSQGPEYQGETYIWCPAQYRVITRVTTETTVSTTFDQKGNTT
jgi:hypothetical protein